VCIYCDCVYYDCDMIVSIIEIHVWGGSKDCKLGTSVSGAGMCVLNPLLILLYVTYVYYVY
jgi:hypothetical protein